MEKVANVFVNIPVKSITKAYSYLVPAELDFVDVGWRVFIPFGNRKVEGFVVEISERQSVESLKYIIAPVDREPWFNSEMLELAYWLAEFYLCSSGEAMRLFMPGKSGSKIHSIYTVGAEAFVATAVSANDLRVYRWIEEHRRADLPAIYKALPGLDIKRIVNVLVKKNLLVKTYDAKKNAAVKTEKYYHLSADIDDSLWETFKRKPAQKKLLEYLRGRQQISQKQLKEQKFSSQVIRETVQAGIVAVTEKQLFRDSYRHLPAEVDKGIVLTAEQCAAFAPLKQAIDDDCHKIFLLHGITGSGKTQIYIEAVQQVRRLGKKAMILVPEIGLTSQMIQRFKTFFPEEVIVIHSRLSLSERNDAIVKIRNGEAFIVIGTRSAIFTPVERLGVIIMDEEHDASYKQDEAPRYHTRDVAIRLAEIYGAVLLLGSATPSVESFQAAEAGKYHLLSLYRRANGTALPLIKIVDMREELQRGRRNIISQSLAQLIEATIARGEQFILLLNRRGFSTFIMCRECGHVISCPHCTLPLTYHRNGSLQCHFCDIRSEIPDICPKCASRYIKYFGSGTEKLEEELEKMFPTARVVRMDRDTTGKKLAHAEILQNFAEKRYDILLGTQMVAKGHDIENVTAVGIISADSSLNLPDFRAAERCFSLITQAAGRAGRGNVRGRVIVQTYNPEHYAVKAGAAQDYRLFYEQESVLRKSLGYPPYSDLIKLTVQHTEERKALAHAQAICGKLRAAFDNSYHQILGPAPSSIPKLRENYRYILLIKSQQIAAVKVFLRDTKECMDMNVAIDVNPLNVT